jgi:hypothetical protein
MAKMAVAISVAVVRWGSYNRGSFLTPLGRPPVSFVAYQHFFLSYKYFSLALLASPIFIIPQPVCMTRTACYGCVCGRQHDSS